MYSALALPRARHAVGSVLLKALLQFGQPDRLGIIAGRRRAPQPPRHPELALRVRVLLLHLVQQLVHRVPQRDVELFSGAVRGQRAAGRHGDRNLVAEHLLRVVFGPNTMGAPDDQRDDRHLRLEGHPGRTGLELSEFETATAGGLRMHPDEFALAQPLHGDVQCVLSVPAVHRNEPGVLDDVVDRLHVGHLGLDHEVHPPAPFTYGEQRREPVEVAGVVLGKQRAAALGNVLQAAERELRSVHRDHRRHYPLAEPVKRLCHARSSFRATGAAPSSPTRTPNALSCRPCHPPRSARLRARAAFSASSRTFASATVGALPPSLCGIQNAPSGWGYSSCTRCSKDVISSRRAASRCSTSPAGDTGLPAATTTGIFLRPTFLGWSFVQIRCAPQTISGTIGTPAANAIRADPVLNSLSSKLRLIVASGIRPTSSPARSNRTASVYASDPARRLTGMVLVCLTKKLTIFTCCISALIM